MESDSAEMDDVPDVIADVDKTQSLLQQRPSNVARVAHKGIAQFASKGLIFCGFGSCIMQGCFLGSLRTGHKMVVRC